MLEFNDDDLIPNGPQPQLVLRPTIGTDKRVPFAAQPWPTESAYLHIDALTPEDGFASEEELNALLIVPYYLKGTIMAESWEIEYVKIGDHTEALEHFQIFNKAWKTTESAIEWISTQI